MTSAAEYGSQWEAMQHLLATPPLQRSGAVILHPKVDLTLRREGDAVKGPLPENYYFILGGQGPSPMRSYTFGRSDTGIIVSGAYQYRPSGSRDLLTYEIVTARFGSAAEQKNADGRKYLARSDFDFEGVATYFDAFSRRGDVNSRVTTIVVDSRDEYNRLRELERAMNEAGAEESRKRLLARIGK